MGRESERVGLADTSFNTEDRNRRRLSCKIETNLQTLLDMTTAQRDALDVLLRDSRWNKVTVHSQQFDLGEGWLYIIASHEPNPSGLTPIHMGISPEGSIHS